MNFSNDLINNFNSNRYKTSIEFIINHRKALEKAKTLATQFVETKAQAAAEMAERAKIVTSIDEQINAILYPEKGKADQQDGQKIING